jgi:hypothetical protein
MAHLRLRRLPALALPSGATSATDGAEVLVEHADRSVLAAWQLDARKAGQLDQADLLGAGEGPAERAPVVVSATVAAELDKIAALPANATNATKAAALNALATALRSP